MLFFFFRQIFRFLCVCVFFGYLGLEESHISSEKKRKTENLIRKRLDRGT